MKAFDNWENLNVIILKQLISMCRNKEMNINIRDKFLKKVNEALDYRVSWHDLDNTLTLQAMDIILKSHKDFSDFLNDMILDLTCVSYAADIIDDILYEKNIISCAECSEYFQLTKKEMENRPMVKFICTECAGIQEKIKNRKENEHSEKINEAISMLKKEGYKVTK